MVKQFNTLSSLSSLQSLLLHVLASASTNRLIDPKWNTELINTVLMRVCCSITCHLNHPAQVLQAIRFLSYTTHLTNLLCHFRRSRNYHKHLPVLTMSTPQCRVITPVRLLFYLLCYLLSHVENRCFSLTTDTYDGLFLHLKWGFMNVTNEVKVQPHWLGW